MKVKFKNNNNAEFFSTLSKRVEEYFVQNDLSKNANSKMVFKTTLILTVFFASYFLLIFNVFNVWGAIGLCMLLGLFKSFIGFNISHDAAHGSYSSKPIANNILSYTFEMLGTSSYMWKIMHNVIHHTYTNIPEHDDDLEPFFMIRLNPTKKAMRVHKYQHWYATFFYALTSFSWVFSKDYGKLFQKEIGGSYQVKKHAPKDVIILLASKLSYYMFFIILPWLVLPFSFLQIIAGFMIMHAVQGISLAIVFQLAHVVEEAEFPEPAACGTIENSWAIHQLYTTANFARNSKLATFFFGGLNFQVEHHLFPRICHVHYRPLSDIVKETALEYGIPYNENTTMWKAIKSHYKMIKRLGVAPQVTEAAA
jgi:linoleoyl-CoA desaturase